MIRLTHAHLLYFFDQKRLASSIPLCSLGGPRRKTSPAAMTSSSAASETRNIPITDEAGWLPHHSPVASYSPSAASLRRSNARDESAELFERNNNAKWYSGRDAKPRLAWCGEADSHSNEGSPRRNGEEGKRDRDKERSYGWLCVSSPVLKYLPSALHRAIGGRGGGRDGQAETPEQLYLTDGKRLS